jgi:hypothetical protein
MPIYQKGTNFTKVKDIYLCTGASDFTRICKVYLCTAANTFELVYDGCAAECDCTCENCTTLYPLGCNYHKTARDPSSFGGQFTHGCGCVENPTSSSQIYLGGTFTAGCYYQLGNCCDDPPGGPFCTANELCFAPCCSNEFTNCSAYNNAFDNDDCCFFSC